MEQTYTKLRDISLYLFMLFLLISIFIWFKFNILETWKDLSGANSSKYLRELRKQNESNNQKSIHNPIDLNISDKKTTPMSLRTGQMEEAYNRKIDEMKLDKHTNPFEDSTEYNNISNEPVNYSRQTPDKNYSGETSKNKYSLERTNINYNEELTSNKINTNKFNTEILVEDNSRENYNTEILTQNINDKSLSYETAMLTEDNKNTTNNIKVYIIEELEYVGSNKTV